MDSTILIVEDDFALREAICDTLEMVGNEIIGAENGHAALEILENKKVDLVLSDIQMGKMDCGLEAKT